VSAIRQKRIIEKYQLGPIVLDPIDTEAKNQGICGQEGNEKNKRNNSRGLDIRSLSSVLSRAGDKRQAKATKYACNCLPRDG
jgi:hypothetical protein